MNLTLLDAFGDFAMTMWMPTLGADGFAERDTAVMSLGLPGEAGEVLELVAAHPVIDDAVRAELMLELGDTLYYLVRLMRAFDYTPSTLWPARTRPVSPMSVVSGKVSSNVALRQAVALSVAVSKVAEVLKKRIRDDGYDRDKLADVLRATAAAWCAVASAIGITPEQAIQANQTKLLDRRARGTRRGSGDHR